MKLNRLLHLSKPALRFSAVSLVFSAILGALEFYTLEVLVGWGCPFPTWNVSNRLLGSTVISVVGLASVNWMVLSILKSRYATTVLGLLFSVVLAAAQILVNRTLTRPLIPNDFRWTSIHSGIHSLGLLFTLGISTLTLVTFTWVITLIGRRLSSRVRRFEFVRDLCIGSLGCIPLIGLFSFLTPMITQPSDSLFGQRRQIARVLSFNPGLDNHFQSYFDHGTLLTLWAYFQIQALGKQKLSTEDSVPLLNAKGEAAELVGLRKGTPNLVLLVLESWVRPGLLGIHHSGEASPTLDRICSESQERGRVQVVPFGGDSPLTEFELLTGLSVKNLGSMFSPFLTVVHSQIPSIPRWLNHEGYHTVAMNSFPYNIQNITVGYRTLGFQTVHYAGTVTRPAQNGSRFGRDDKLVETALAELAGPGPQFVYAFASGTHGLYDFDWTQNSSISASGYSADTNQQLTTYLRLLKRLDDDLTPFFSAIEKSEKPTEVLILGDHLPPWPIETLNQLNLVSETDLRRGFFCHWRNSAAGRPQPSAVQNGSLQPEPELPTYALTPRWLKSLRISSPLIDFFDDGFKNSSTPSESWQKDYVAIEKNILFGDNRIGLQELSK